jgi:hypothetical protein
MLTLDVRGLLQKIEQTGRTTDDAIIKTIQVQLEEFFGAGDDARRRIAAARKRFDADLLWEIAREPAKRSRVESEVVPIHQQMQQLAERPDPSAQTLLAFRELDGNFHAALCEIGHGGACAQVIRLVHQALGDKCVNRSRAEMLAILEEHSEILTVICRQDSDKKLVARVSDDHIDRSVERWMQRKADKASSEALAPSAPGKDPTRMNAKIEAVFAQIITLISQQSTVTAWMESAARAEAAELLASYGSSIPPLAIDRVASDIVLHKLHSGEFVAFIDGVETRDGAKRLRREIVATGMSPDIADRPDVQLRYLEPVDLLIAG